MDHPPTVIPAEGAQGRRAGTQRNIMTGDDWLPCLASGLARNDMRGVC
jgi:hypothetical protein